jgi:acetyl-CoA C-acetyltransferase/acetyl-CoA acyltransferase
MERVFEMSGLKLKDMDKVEFMEAFAVTIARFYRDYQPSMEQVNVGGGHLAKGHPLGASGAILVSALLDSLDFSGGRYGLVVATGASGTGSAMIVERMEG